MKITISTAQGTQTTYEYEQLAQMWKDGMLKAETLYWKEGMTDWKPLGELFAGLAPPPLPSGNPSPGRKISQMKRVNPRRKHAAYRWTKEPHMLTATLIFLLLICCGLYLFNCWFTYEETKLLESASEGIQVEDSVWESSDNKLLIVGSSYIIVFLITAITFMKWTYRANQNSRGFGAQNMKYTPGWSASYYIIPIICLFKPYKVMLEVWKVSMNPAKWNDQGGTLLVSFWWYSWIIVGFLGNAIMKQFFKAQNVKSMIATNQISMVHDILSLIVALLAILVINTIYNNQKRLVAG
jgi:hypothetical protein